jgi:hypothetical protein
MNRFNRVAVGVLASFAVSTAAHATGTLASPLMWGGTTQTDAVCYIRNTGKSPVDDSGLNLTDSSSCSSVAPGSTCAVAALSLGTNQPVACSASTSGSTKYIRAAMDIRRDSGGVVTILNQQDLR